MRSISLGLLAVIGVALSGCGKSETHPAIDSTKKTRPQADQEGAPQGGTGQGVGSTPKVPHDLARLQGIWRVEKYDAADPITAPPPAVLATMRYSFEGKKLQVERNILDKKITETFTFELDLNSDPRGMLVTRVDEAGKPLQAPYIANEQWIYKWDGDDLVLAKSGPNRPSAFVPKPPSDRPPNTGGDEKDTEGLNKYGVSVIHLKKDK
jgi:uncharacterized protein (TIGR03067 family)